MTFQPALIYIFSITIKQQKKQKENTFFTAKFQHLNLKAPSINVKIQSEESLTTQTYFFVCRKQMGLYINETRWKVDKSSKNEAKFKNKPTFSKPNIYKPPKNL